MLGFWIIIKCLKEKAWAILNPAIEQQIKHSITHFFILNVF